MKLNVVEYPDRDMMMMDVAQQVAEELESALLSTGTATLAVPGGSTPGPMFDDLCAADLNWAGVSVLLTDERCVPATSNRSNAKLLRERLFVNRAAAATYVPIYGDGADTVDIKPLLPIDVLVLGMGADMHTASLFPGAVELAGALASDAPSLVQVTPPGGLEPRVSLSGPVLKGAISTHVLITGAEKREALETAAKLPDIILAPIRLVMQDATIHWAE
ncbi:MAG: 6-phosphogluconolactonase [Pseudomonadota bacterium]